MKSNLSSCPIDYLYPPESLHRPPDLLADTLYVVGGLYGNPEALAAVLDMQAREERRGAAAALVFNGDFHWFDTAREDFLAIDEGVAAHAALAGNVEAELAREGPGQDCGCDYPAYVERGVVERSNRIFARLKRTALAFPEARRRLGGLPRHLVAQVGPCRVAILHGDPCSLAGWSLAQEALAEAGADPARPSGAALVPQTSSGQVAAYFRASGADAFATTHTCLAFARDFEVDGVRRLIVNNGSAGMPNFQGLPGGLLTRISTEAGEPPESLYGMSLRGVRFDALPIPFDQGRWVRRFLHSWPEGSPAHQSYFERILHGPPYALARAMRGGVTGNPLRQTA